MKTSTRLVFLLALLLAQLSAVAATITIKVDDFEYSPQFVTLHPGDVVVWQWVGGNHPTASDNGAWSTFQMNAANTAKNMSFPTVGSFPYHCTAHGAPGVGMYGIITVSAATPVEEARPATPTLSVYPNPSKGMVMVAVSQKPGQDYKLRLSNIIGREVRTVTLKPEADGEAMPVNLSDLPAGMYFYTLLVNDKIVSTKRLTLQN